MVVVLFIVAGDHVPLNPLLEVVGSAGMLAPAQYVVTNPLNMGAMLPLFIVMVMVAVVAHCPASGVKV